MNIGLHKILERIINIDAVKIWEKLGISKHAYIEKPFNDMEEMSSVILNMLFEIKDKPYKCETIIYNTRNQLQPKITKLIKNFEGKYYSRSKARTNYAKASRIFLNTLNHIFDLPHEPYSNLTSNSFLTLIEHRDIFTIYSYKEDSFLGKIKKLSIYYYQKVDDEWKDVCETKTCLYTPVI